MAEHPHCDSLILHKNGECDYCDVYPDRQAQRIADGINFTGHKDPNKKPCPSEALRPAYIAHRWHGNRPTNIEVPLEPPSKYAIILESKDED